MENFDNHYHLCFSFVFIFLSSLDAGWDDEILRKEILDLNKLDFDVSLAGFDINDFDFTQEDIEFQEDNFDVEASLPEIAKAKYGDIYQLGRHRLMCGDSTSRKMLIN